MIATDTITAYDVFKKITHGFSFGKATRDATGKTSYSLVCHNGKLILSQARIAASMYGLNEHGDADNVRYFSKLGVCMVKIETIGNTTRVTVNDYDLY